MNNTFSFDRFKLVLAKDANDFRNRFGVTLLIVTLLPILVWIFGTVVVNIGMRSTASISPEPRILFIFGLPIIAAILAPSRIYKMVNQKKNGVMYAMLPASKMEKYLSMLFYCIVVTPILCLIGGLILDTFLVAVFPFGIYSGYFWQARVMDYFSLSSTLFYGVSYFGILAEQLLGFMLTVAIFIFTNTIFKKQKTLKTIGSLMLIYFVFTMFILTAVFSSVSIHNIEWVKELILSFNQNWFYVVYVLYYCFFVGFIGLVFWGTYYRLKKMTY